MLGMLWTISLLARSFRGHYRSRSIRDPAAGWQVYFDAELREAGHFEFRRKQSLGKWWIRISSSRLLGREHLDCVEAEQAKADFHVEVLSLGQIWHRNVVQLLGWCQEKGRLLLVYDYLPNGSLDA